MPALRDALVSKPLGRSRLGDRLGIATEYGGCHKTTRITQAIETFQIILWSVRMGTLADMYPDLKLVAPDFDEEWKWIGSYATWRAAMFVFLYPENLLLPSLRRLQTPGFRRLVEELRGIRKLTPARAREAAERYAAYFRDLCTLGDLQAAVLASTTFDFGNLDLWYVFAAGGDSGQIYWMAFGYHHPDALSFWDVVPGLVGKKATVADAGAYQVLGDKRYLYLLLTTNAEGKEELGFTRYDLINRAWQPEVSRLELPNGVTQFTAVLREKASVVDLPRIALRDSATKIFYDRYLDKVGLDWEEGDWSPRAQLWKPWASADPTTLNAGKLKPGGRLFATRYVGNAVFIAGLGQDQQVYGFHWNDRFFVPRIPANIVPVPKFSGSLLPGAGGITGTFRMSVPPPPDPQAPMDQIDLFTVANDLGVYTAKWVLWSGWRPWARVGSANAFGHSIVAATTRDPQIIDIFIIGTSRDRWQNSWGKETQYQWTGFVDSAGGPFVFIRRWASSVGTVIALSPRRLEWLFKPLLWEFLANMTWSVETDELDESGSLAWRFSPGVPGEVPEAAVVTSAVRTGHIFDLFVPRATGEIWTVQRDVKSEWRKWAQVGERSTRFGETAVVLTIVRNSGYVLLFATDNDGIVQSNWQRDGVDNGKWHNWGPIEVWSAPEFSSNGYVAAVRSNATMFYAPTVTIFTVGKDGNIYWTEALENLREQPVHYFSIRLHPGLWPNTSAADLIIRETMSEAQRTSRPSWVKAAFDYHSYAIATGETKIGTYLEEAFHFVPVHMALQLQKSGAYIAALDWFRLVYEYTAPAALRKLVGLAPEGANASDAYQRKIESWLLDPLNPHAIAETRSNAYTRFTLQSIVRCLLDYADSEFTKDTAESVPRARELYELVLELLDAPELRQNKGECEQIIGDLSIAVNDPHWEWIGPEIKKTLKGISDASVLKEVVPKLLPILAVTSPAHQKYAALQPILSKLTEASAEVIPVGTFSSKMPTPKHLCWSLPCCQKPRWQQRWK